MADHITEISFPSDTKLTRASAANLALSGVPAIEGINEQDETAERNLDDYMRRIAEHVAGAFYTDPDQVGEGSGDA